MVLKKYKINRREEKVCAGRCALSVCPTSVWMCSKLNCSKRQHYPIKETVFYQHAASTVLVLWNYNNCLSTKMYVLAQNVSVCSKKKSKKFDNEFEELERCIT